MNIEKLLSEAKNFMRDGDVEKAQFFLNQILAKFPKNPDALTQNGIILIHKKNFKKGINSIQSSLLIKSNQPEALLHLGMAFYQENKFDEAIKCFDEAIKFKLDYAEAFYTKALSYQKKNLIEDAIINFELAIQHNPNNINPIINLGYLFYDLEDFDKAINLFKKADILYPNNKEFLDKIEEISLIILPFEDAVQYLNNAIKLNPNDAYLYSARGVKYMNAKMFKHALSDLNKALQLLPGDLTCLANRASVHLSLDQLIEAETDCRILQKFEVQHYDTLISLGVTNKKLKNNDIAFSYFEKAINLNPNNPIGFLEKALHASALGKKDLAKIYYNNCVKKFPNDSKVQRTAGIFFLTEKEFKKGWDLYTHRLELKFLEPARIFIDKISQTISRWEGEINCESLLVVGEQGVGDQIIYLSMLLELSKKIKKITVLISPKLNQLFSRSFKNVNFISVDTATYNISLNLLDYDFYVLTGDLGRFLRPSIESFQNQPYRFLKSDIEKTKKIRSEFKTSKLVCGISWASQVSRGTTFADLAKFKNVTLTELIPIFNLNNVIFVKLQYGDVSAEISHFKNNITEELMIYHE